MAAPHDLCWNPLFSCQMICKQYIILHHVFFRYKSNLKIQTHYSTILNVSKEPFHLFIYDNSQYIKETVVYLI